jgi:hypothetical protein
MTDSNSLDNRDEEKDSLVRMTVSDFLTILRTNMSEMATEQERQENDD